MLGHRCTHSEYQSYLAKDILLFHSDDPKMWSNIWIHYHNFSYLTSIVPILANYYFSTGAPAKIQSELIRSFILMSELRVHGITNWFEKLTNNKNLCTTIGLHPSEIHNSINRMWPWNPELEHEYKKTLHNFKRKSGFG